jgi:hypothetical protein
MPQSPTTLVACPCVHPLARPLPEQLEAVFATAQVFELTGCHVANRKLRIRRASRTNGHTASNANARQGGTGLVNGLAFFRIRPPLTRSPIQILTASHPRSLRSLVKSNKVLSCSRRSRSSHKCLFVGSMSQLVRCRLQLSLELSVVPGKATIGADHRSHQH